MVKLHSLSSRHMLDNLWPMIDSSGLPVLLERFLNIDQLLLAQQRPCEFDRHSAAIIMLNYQHSTHSWILSITRYAVLSSSPGATTSVQ